MPFFFSLLPWKLLPCLSLIAFLCLRSVLPRVPAAELLALGARRVAPPRPSGPNSPFRHHLMPHAKGKEPGLSQGLPSGLDMC